MQRHSTAPRRPGRPALNAITLALLAGLGSHAAAAELVNNDSLQLRWDNSVKYTVGVRTKEPTSYYLDNPNTNDGDAPFKRGDLITNRLDWLTEFDLGLKDKAHSGFRISAAGWYDNVYRGSHDAVPAATYNATSVSNTEYTAYARKWAGQGADLLDAFVHTGVDIGSHNLGLRLGRHTVMWGESLLLANNGISAAQAPVDVQKVLTVPGIQVKDFLMPVNQLSASFNLNDNWDLAGYYQLEFRKSRIPAPGTYFSPADVVFDGSENIVIVPGAVYAPRVGGPTPSKKNGQWGVAAKFRDPAVGWDFGAYYLRYTAKTPLLFANLGMLPPPAPGADPIFFPTSYYFVYPEKIDLFGLSTSGHVGDANVAGEMSIRNNMPLESNVGIFPAGAPAYDRNNPAYATGRVLTFQASTIWQVPRNPLWETATLVAEAGGNTLLEVTKNDAARDTTKGRTSLLSAISFEPGWYQALPDVDLYLPLNVTYNFNKRDAVVIGDPRGGSASIGVRFNYANSIKGGLSYTHYLGSDTNTPWGDRNFVTLNVNYSF